jgi:rhomboid protease GluP
VKAIVPRGAIALVCVIACCAVSEWHLRVFDSRDDIVRLVAASRAVVLHGEVQRLLTASFFHLSPSHVLANSVGLLVVGGYLEFRVGTPRFVVIALVSAFGSISGSLLVQYVPWVAGASGMLYGLYGALAALLVRYWNDWHFDHPVPRWLAICSMIGLLVVSHLAALRALPAFAIIDHGNHWSGFAVGALATTFVTKDCPASALRRDDGGTRRTATWIVALFAIAFLAHAVRLWTST